MKMKALRASKLQQKEKETYSERHGPSLKALMGFGES